MASKKRKKKAAKKKTRTARNPLTAHLEAKREFAVESGNVYLVRLKGEGKSSVELGHVTAPSESAARTKAKSYLKRLL